MDKQLLRSFLILVNDPNHFPLLQEYANARILILQAQLETAREIDRIRELQGAISELRRFKTLRAEVIEGAK